MSPPGRPEREQAQARVMAKGGEGATTLDRVPAGATVRLGEPDTALDSTFREHLAAYGLVPGHCVTVLAQKPMTLVLCDHVELALEHEVAAKLRVAAAG